MPKLKRLSGPEVTSILQHFGFSILSQRGSHIKLRRINQVGENQTLTVLNHQQLEHATLFSAKLVGTSLPTTFGHFSIRIEAPSRCIDRRVPIQRPIGLGRRGQVSRAQDTRLNRDVPR